jgi:hypothetical protein
MGHSTRIKVTHGLRTFRANLRRKRVLRHLNRDLAGYSNKELADLLARARMRRSELFTGFTGNRPNRQLMGRMLRHFDIDRELACEHHWRKLVHAEKACARCANAEKCQLAVLARTTTRTYAYGAAFSSPQAEAVGSALRRQRRHEAAPPWRRGLGQSD